VNIVVCVKYVPDATGNRTFDDTDNTVDRYGVDGLLSELDEYAIEEGLVLADAHGGQVTALTMGPEPASNAVRKALQMGASRGVHVLDPGVHGSDSAATSLVLATAIQKVGAEAPVDMVICGMASTDGSMGVVPAMLAERLGLPQVTFASEVTVEGSTVRIRRDGDTATEIVEASTPLVLSVTDQCNEPRYPSFKGIMAAKKKPVDTWSLADLELEPSQVGLAAAWTKVASFEARPPRTAGKVVPDDGTGGQQLAEYLASQRFL
jgi:electron transfer flavoprotein beta subunit